MRTDWRTKTSGPAQRRMSRQRRKRWTRIKTWENWRRRRVAVFRHNDESDEAFTPLCGLLRGAGRARGRRCSRRCGMSWMTLPGQRLEFPACLLSAWARKGACSSARCQHEAWFEEECRSSGLRQCSHCKQRRTRHAASSAPTSPSAW